MLADKISRLIIWFSLKKRDLSEEDKSRLDSSLVECYQQYGIDFDNRSLLDADGEFQGDAHSRRLVRCPAAGPPETRHLAVVLARYVTGSAAAMGGRNNVLLDNKFIVLDISGLSDDMIADGNLLGHRRGLRPHHERRGRSSPPCWRTSCGRWWAPAPTRRPPALCWRW